MTRQLFDIRIDAQQENFVNTGSIDAAMKQNTDCIAIGLLEAQKKNERVQPYTFSQIQKRMRVELRDMSLEVLEISRTEMNTVMDDH